MIDPETLVRCKLIKNKDKMVYLIMQGTFDDRKVMGVYSTQSKAEKAILEFRDKFIQKYKNQIELHKQHLNDENYKQETLKTFQIAIKNIHSHKPYTMEDIEEMIKVDIQTEQDKINNFKGNDWTEWSNDWDEYLWIQEHNLDD